MWTSISSKISGLRNYCYLFFISRLKSMSTSTNFDECVLPYQEIKSRCKYDISIFLWDKFWWNYMEMVCYMHVKLTFEIKCNPAIFDRENLSMFLLYIVWYLTAEMWPQSWLLFSVGKTGEYSFLTQVQIIIDREAGFLIWEANWLLPNSIKVRANLKTLDHDPDH